MSRHKGIALAALASDAERWRMRMMLWIAAKCVALGVAVKAAQAPSRTRESWREGLERMWDRAVSVGRGRDGSDAEMEMKMEDPIR